MIIKDGVDILQVNDKYAQKAYMIFEKEIIRGKFDMSEDNILFKNSFQPIYGKRPGESYV